MYTFDRIPFNRIQIQFIIVKVQILSVILLTAVKSMFLSMLISFFNSRLITFIYVVTQIKIGKL